jgi:hypothetical protein
MCDSSVARIRRDVNIPVRESGHAGLCERCRNARILDSKTGSRFYLCELSSVNPAFPKYPRIPVLHCQGYVRRT